MTNLIALPDGTELVGDYRIERVLGAGGFGITYLADELALERRVTIKEYFPSDFAARSNQLDASPRSQGCAGDYRWGLERFIEEAQTLAKFNHPHIVRVYRYFQANNTAYMVLHFEEGQSLKGWLKGLGRAPRQRELDRILAPLLEALELIHAADFLHRDIAPDNIIIRKDGSPVLIDFGSARGEIAAHSKTVSALVKPGYSPYEQYAETSRQQGPWTDIYALAATLYHAVTGRRPPDAPSRMLNDEYVPARDAALGAYRARFLRAIDSALALNVDARPRSIAVWRTELLGPENKGESRRWRSNGRGGKSEAPKDSGPAEPAAPTEVIAHPSVAPPSRSGILNFVRRKPQSATQAEINADQPAQEPADADPVKPSGGTRAARRKAAPQLAKTVKIRTAPPPVVLKKRGKKAAIQKDEPVVDTSAKPAARKAETQESAPPKSAARSRERKMTKAAPPAAPRAPVLPVASPAIEERKPARPRANRGGGQSGWTSHFAKLILIGGLSTGVIAAHDQFPKVDVSGFLPSITGPTVASGTGGSLPASRQRPETTASLQRPDEIPSSPLLNQLVGHTGTVTALTYSPDGRSIISAGADATVRIWTATSGLLARVIPLDHGAATAIAVQGDRLATGHADGYIAVWDMSSGHKLADLRRNEAAIWSLAFTDVQGRLVAAGHDWKVSLWDLRTPAAPIHIFDGHENAVQAVAFSAKGPYLASGAADRTVRLWNLNTLDPVRTYSRFSDFVTSVRFSPDGSQIASATLDGEIRIVSAASQRNFRRLRGHKDSVTGLSFAPSGSLLASSSADGTIRLWDVRRARTLRTLASHPGHVTGLDFAPDGSRLITAGDDGKIRIWAVPVSAALR